MTMRVASLYLKNFKRFTDCTISDLPDTAKLVLVVGANGNGKSTLFEAFHNLSDNAGKQQIGLPPERKDTNIQEFEIYFSTTTGLKFGYTERGFVKSAGDVINGKSFYGRSSFRQVSMLDRKQLGKHFNIEMDDDRPRTFINRDERFQNDLETIFGQIIKRAFTEDDIKAIK